MVRRHSAIINHGLPHCSPINHVGRGPGGEGGWREMKPIRLCQECALSFAPQTNFGVFEFDIPGHFYEN